MAVDADGDVFVADTFNYAVRGTGLPLYTDEGRQLVHLGLPAEFVPHSYGPAQHRAFREGFSRALREGLPLEAPADCLYAGTITRRVGRTRMAARWVAMS